MVEVMLNRLAEISFKIFDVYKELIDVDSKRQNDPNYKNLRKVIVDKIATLRSDEDEIYDELRSNPKLAGECLFYFNKRKSEVKSVNKSIHSIDLTKDYTIVQERIQSSLEKLCVEQKVITADIDNAFINYLCFKENGFDRRDAINIFILLQRKFISNLTLKSCKFSDEFFEDVDNYDLMVNMLNRKHLRAFVDRDVEKERLKKGFDGYTMKLKEESKNDYGIDEVIINDLYEFLALQFLKENIPILFKSSVSNSSVSILFDIQSALIYLDDEDLKVLYLTALVWKSEDELIKNILLAAIKQTDYKKKQFNSDLDTTKDF